MERSGNDVPPEESLEEMEREAGKVLPPPPGHPRFHLLDSLRAIAAVSVLLVHVGIVTGGFDTWYRQLFAHLDIGVPFFFLLSGFLLYRPMLAARLTGLPKQRTVDYARNRFFRIMPAFWVVLAVTALVPGFHGAFTGNWWVYWGLLQNFPVYTADGACVTDPLRCGVPVAWSLSIEVLFYLLLPVYAVALAGLTRLAGRRRWLAVELTALALISAVSLYIQSSVPTGDLHIWLFFSPIGRGWWFALGMGLAVMSVRAQMRQSQEALSRTVTRIAIPLWMLGILLYAFTSIVVLEPLPSLAFPVIDETDYLFSVVAFGLIAFVILLPAIFNTGARSLVSRILGHGVLVWLGLISYGIFLWHVPVLAALLDLGIGDTGDGLRFPVTALATFLVTTGMAAISFYLIERPLMLRVRRRKSG